MAVGPENRQPIIIKRVKKITVEGHGGAWKVAYADFVTAMMAFFLLLWLLNATSEAQKQGIADYFDPMSVSETTSGAGGVLGGQDITQDGHTNTGGPPTVVSNMEHGDDDRKDGQASQATPQDVPADSADVHAGDATGGPNSSAVATPAPGDQAARSEAVESSGGNGRSGNGQAATDGGGLGKQGPRPGQGLADAQGQKAAAGAAGQGDGPASVRLAAQSNMGGTGRAAAETQHFQAAAEQLKQMVGSDPSLTGIAKQMMIDITPQGLQIQLVDQQNKPMFESGSARMSPELVKLLAKIAGIVANLPNRVAIAGHTDSTPYRNVVGYTNWELSADRANAARRLLVEDGLKPSRLYQVSGKADSEPLLPETPKDPSNRRITITLMREAPVLPPGMVPAVDLPAGVRGADALP